MKENEYLKYSTPNQDYLKLKCKRTGQEIKAGDHIKDVEDGDCWFEGIMQNDKEYLVIRTVWNGIEYNSKNDDDVIGTITTHQWYYMELL